MLVLTYTLHSLENLKFFDVTHVGRLCPKLISLKLSNILSYCRCLQINQLSLFGLYLTCLWLNSRVAEVARSREGASPKSYDSDENFEPLHTF